MLNSIQIFTDGGSRGNPGPAAAAFVALSEVGQLIHQEGHCLGKTTNNQAEYQAVIFALKWLSSQTCTSVHFFLDSLLVVNQINGTFKIKDVALKERLISIKNIISSSPSIKFTFSYVPRAQNFRADKLVNETLDASLSSK
jgi:ribonuclease HI